MLSNVTIVRRQGLGKTAAREDGISGIIADGVAIPDKLALDTPYVITSLSEAESKGVTQQYDLTNKVLLWHHIHDFYLKAPKGTRLYFFVVQKETSMADTIGGSEGAARKLLTFAKGDIKLLAVTSMSEEFSALEANITKAQNLYDWAAERNKALNILIEGRGFSDDYTEAPSSREMAANRVSVVVSQDYDVAAEDPAFANYAHVALLLGTLAGIAVSRDAGRVRNGSIGVSAVGISNGKKSSDVDYYDDDQLSVIDSKGYLFLRKFDGLAGWYWNADYTAAPATDDCSSIRMGRTLDKAADLARLKALEYMRDDVEIDTDTGYVASEVLQSIQADIETAVLSQMSDEISGVACVIDPEQALWDESTPLLADLEIVARGVIAHMKMTVYYTNSLSND